MLIEKNVGDKLVIYGNCGGTRLGDKVPVKLSIFQIQKGPIPTTKESNRVSSENFFSHPHVSFSPPGFHLCP
jgi:hypothetical protein